MSHISQSWETEYIGHDLTFFSVTQSWFPGPGLARGVWRLAVKSAVGHVQPHVAGQEKQVASRLQDPLLCQLPAGLRLSLRQKGRVML